MPPDFSQSKRCPQPRLGPFLSRNLVAIDDDDDDDDDGDDDDDDDGDEQDNGDNHCICNSVACEVVDLVLHLQRA